MCAGEHVCALQSPDQLTIFISFSESGRLEIQSSIVEVVTKVVLPSDSHQSLFISPIIDDDIESRCRIVYYLLPSRTD